MSGYNLKKYIYILQFWLFFFTYTNGVDPDEMQHNAAFHLGLHCFQKCLFQGFPNYKGLTEFNSLHDGKFFWLLFSPANFC